MSGNDFYTNLRPITLPLNQVLDPQYFSDIPSDWFIIITDVKNSTAAIKEGKHNDVNMVAAASLIAALNIAKEKQIEIPFFFGGDGGTFLVPGAMLDEVLAALAIHNENSRNNFDLQMHIGCMQVKEVLDSGHFLKIAKFQMLQSFSKPIVVGDGLQFAEQQVKLSGAKAIDVKENEQVNLTGLECRWDKIKPPAQENEIVCYLIESVHPARQLAVYRDVLNNIEEIYGDFQMRHPLSVHQLKLLVSFQKIKDEMLTKRGKWDIGYFLKTFIKTLVGVMYFKYNWRVNNLTGREYLSQLIANADTLTIDGRINTIISGKTDKRMRLTRYLAEQEEKGNLIYGHHISKESVMTCYIENRNSRHIHFVDGADGGYTEASKEFKMKAAKLLIDAKQKA